jgi:hypothetical protein
MAAQMTLVNQALAAIEHSWATKAMESPPSAPRRPEPTYDDAADDTFSVDWLPAEAFEILFLAAYGLGDILVADEPYLLELYLLEPAPCFCRLGLMPEAGGSLVTVDVTPADGAEAPAAAAVIDVLVTELNTLLSG